MLEGVRGVTFFTISHEQTQLNWICNFHLFILVWLLFQRSTFTRFFKLNVINHLEKLSITIVYVCTRHVFRNWVNFIKLVLFLCYKDKSAIRQNVVQYLNLEIKFGLKTYNYEAFVYIQFLIYHEYKRNMLFPFLYM